MPSRSICICFIAFAAIACASAAAAADKAGTVKIVQGSVSVQRQQTILPVAVGDPLYAEDRIVTAGDGSIGMTLRDDTLLSLGPKSSFVLEQYQFDPSDNSGKIIASITKGTLRFVTGLVGKLTPESQQLRTPTATIGIRGTDFIVDVPDE
ncbi:hypothetical protein D9O50_11920 [Oxalobacteraceae bacterium CAVE-383]|nr:hypothetical protein D9O50_11920 [Oxalobacteraceae bacterium CAVE-383]